MQSHIKIPIPTQRRVMLDCSSAQGNWRQRSKGQKSLNRQEESVIGIGKLVATAYQGYSRKSRNSTRFRTQKVEVGHIISLYRQTVCLTCREPSRSLENFMIGNRRII